ncbi:hypothetical protein FISHEDRAFT_12590, partial [Fistulina hepatica ATCC 64428]
GARLATLTQKVAYRGIKEQQRKPTRATTNRNIKIIRAVATDSGEEEPTNERIWKSIRDGDVTKKIHVFLWRLIHNAYKIGPYWDHIPEHEHWGVCPHCRTPETMQHILTDCQIPGQEQVWELVQEIWEKKKGKWSNMTIGKIMAAAIEKPKTRRQRAQKARGADRLYQILITESAHLIWTLRCECRIMNEDDPEKWQTIEEIKNRWLARIDTWLALDRIMTSRKKFRKRAAKAEVVLRTWSGVLHGEKDLPENWIVRPRVLVGSSVRRRPRGRNR